MFGIALFISLAWIAPALAAEQTMRLRVAWGGGAPRQWRAAISLKQSAESSYPGAMSKLRSLGIEADEPGSIWLSGGMVHVDARSVRTYDGFDVTVAVSTLDDRLVLEMTPLDNPAQGKTIEISLSKLIATYYDDALDKAGNRLLVRRAPDDTLRLSYTRGALIFAPGESFELELLPNLVPLKARERIRFEAKLLPVAGGEPVWTQHDELDLRPPADVDNLAGKTIPYRIPMPKEEGVYNLIVEATHQGLRSRLGWKEHVTQRSLQLVVLRGVIDPAPLRREDDWKTEVEIDPANPSWWKRFTAIRIPGLKSAPLGSGAAEAWRHPLGRLTRLNPASTAGDISWQAYQLPVQMPGKPYLLEVEYPDDAAQTLGISVVEPNAAGTVTPIGVDSGVDVGETPASGEARLRTHRVLFWPRTKAPVVLLTNRRSHAPAVYGKIRLLSGPDRPPRAFSAQGPAPRRRLLAFLSKPLIAESVSAPEALDTASGRVLDDWQTFYEGGKRLVDYLNHVGYTGLMVGAYADGSAIYPSDHLQSTPRYDTGVFFGSGQDPARKDVLELMFRLFDREGLSLTPSLDFSAPLPELESLLRRQGPAATGVRWVGADGQTRVQAHGTRYGLAPYYNVLNPHVQAAMLRVAREVITRYASHPSFDGLAIQLSADGFAQLPGAAWGFDDETISQFERDTMIRVPGAGPERFAQRAKFLTGPNRGAWLTWRAAALRVFYQRLGQEIAAMRPGARLYLAGGRMLDRPDIERKLRPALPPEGQVDALLLELGIDDQLARKTPEVTLLRSRQIAPLNSLGEQAVSLELGRVEEIDAVFRGGLHRAALFYHPPLEARLKSFDEQSPFRDTFTWLVTQAAPSGDANRRRFVRALASLDPNLMVDGGWLTPLGQEDALRELVAIYRQLPSAEFQLLPGVGQPVKVRWLSFGRETYVCLVNDSPWRATVRVRLELPEGCRGQRLGLAPMEAALQRDAKKTTWEVAMRPFDLVAARFDSPDVVVSQPNVEVDKADLAKLRARVDDLLSRAASLNQPSAYATLPNAGFEQPPEPDGEIPAWQFSAQPGASADVDEERKFAGARSVRLQSDGPLATLVSQPIAPPTTGRMAVWVRLRIADAKAQPPLRLAVEARLRGQEYYRHAPVGQGSQVVKLTERWADYVFPIHDLPFKGLADLRVRFDLMGPGKVWIDDVRVFDIHFDRRTELLELSKLVTLVNVKLQRGQVSDCLRLLEGYWPRFLAAHVAPSPELIGRKSQQEAQKRTASKPKKPGFAERVNGYLPRWMRF